MKSILVLLTSMLSLIFHRAATGQAINNLFDELTGTNTYSGGLGTINWVDGSGYGINNNAGSEAFLSAVGTDYYNLGLIKDLGGIIEDTVYEISFFVGKYYGDGITFADFSILRIGGPNGVVMWNQTPEPVVDGMWYQWTGTYTPDITDVGLPFVFTAKFDLFADHSIAIDGPVIVSGGVATGLELNSDVPGINIFPNPAADNLTLTLSSAPDTQFDIVVLNEMAQPQLVRKISGQSDQTILDVAGLMEGIYFVKVTSENISSVKKIAVAR